MIAINSCQKADDSNPAFTTNQNESSALARNDNSYVFPINALHLKAALESKGATVPFLMLTGEQGFCHGDCWRRAETEMFLFFDRWLRP